MAKPIDTVTQTLDKLKAKKLKPKKKVTPPPVIEKTEEVTPPKKRKTKPKKDK